MRSIYPRRRGDLALRRFQKAFDDKYIQRHIEDLLATAILFFNGQHNSFVYVFNLLYKRTPVALSIGFLPEDSNTHTLNIIYNQS